MYGEVIMAFPEPGPHGEVLVTYPGRVYAEPEVCIGPYAPIYVEPVYNSYAPIYGEPIYI